MFLLVSFVLLYVSTTEQPKQYLMNYEGTFIRGESMFADFVHDFNHTFKCPRKYDNCCPN